MDWNAIQQYLPLYQKAAVLTVRLGVAGIIFAIIIGLACAVIQYDKVPVLRQIVGVYIQLSRNTPLLVQLFFIYYGLPKVGIRTNAEICGIAGLAEGLHFVLRRTPEAIFAHEQRLLRRMYGVLEPMRGVRPFFGSPQAGVVSFTTETMDCEEAAQLLGQRGIAVRAGLHCAPVAHESAGTFASGTVRLSFSAFNTEAEIARFAAVCGKVFSDGGEIPRIPTCYCGKNRI